MSRISTRITLALALLLLLGGPARAAISPDEVIDQVEFQQHLGDTIPADIAFRDENGNRVQLGDYYGDGPVVVVLASFECTKLCTRELNGLVATLHKLELTAGEDFTVLAISFAAPETPELAHEKKQSYLALYDRPGGAEGFHFLTGEQPAIDELCEAVGFRYLYDPETNQYAHASGLMVLTPRGELSRYFFGVDYPSGDLRLALVESSEGQIGSPVDSLLLLCYGYDPATGKYGFLITRVIRLLGLATVLGIGGFIAFSLWRDRRGKQQVATTSSPTPN